MTEHRPRRPRNPDSIRAAAAALRQLHRTRYAAVANMLDDIADGHWTLTTDAVIPISDILGNAATRRLCGNITRHTLIRWRNGLGVAEPFPPPFKRINGDELWDRRAVRAWLAANRFTD